MSALDVEQLDGGVCVVRLNRPERLNAIDEVMLGELERLCARLTDDDDVRVVVLTGAGRGFCAGLDLRGFGPSATAAETSAAARMQFQERMAALPTRLRALPQPVVVAVNGPAVGGGLALCLASDLRICARSASFANAAIRIGLTGGEMGMSYFLPRIVGLSVAADWMLTGRTVPAEEADARGLVSELVDDDRLLTRAVELARSIAEGSALAVHLTKRALQVNADAPDLGAALELENRNQVIAYASEEAAAAREQWSNR